MTARNAKPYGGHRRAFPERAYQSAATQLYGTALARTSSSRLPVNWRERLPDPLDYYSAHLKLTGPNASGNASARCPFHEDRNASLSVCTTGRGLWRCHASCGGGDMVSFHIRLTGKAFADAVRELIGARS